MITRREFNKSLSLFAAGMVLPVQTVQAKQYLTIEQAKQLLFGNLNVEVFNLTLSKAQMKQIRAKTKTKVLNASPKIWRVSDGGWFIVDQVIGKHENIDMAYGLNADGTVRGMEILTYRESYGYEVANPAWRAQFHGKSFGESLKLDKQIKNISGATLSCRHITDGINRLTYTWQLALKEV